MNLQQKLEAAIQTITTDSQLLHQVIHGDDQTEVTTESGQVNSIARTIQLINDRLTSSLLEIKEALTAVNRLRSSGPAVSQSIAETLATAQRLLSRLPDDLAGHAGEILQVNQSGDGYITATYCFYGLRLENQNLFLDSGNEEYQTSNYLWWLIAPPGLVFTLTDDQQLLIEF